MINFIRFKGLSRLGKMTIHYIYFKSGEVIIEPSHKPELIRTKKYQLRDGEFVFTPISI
jgi:hypothetical protein